MNIIIYTLVILTIFYLLVKKFTTISSKKISKSARMLLIIGLSLLAILFAVGGRYLLTLPLTLASLALLKLKGLSIFQLISLFRLIPVTLECSHCGAMAAFVNKLSDNQKADYRFGSEWEHWLEKVDG